ncbi:hypothetical protein N7478_013178 [Penicillium angulare]|uniref:uncharacterized protein n=1 Tax=Penicillium angulare TaxID=116970 RepID=UPI00253FF232|nr:uncharacterized protein N7478_013178 [Penicillium angulare]KAJ5257074.1 hypothetical protein N7478_013178 [Penicillium angulare]
MDLIPPSYESATDRDAWTIIAHYIPSSDLCAASLVCHKWHEVFMPFLWGDPASHFGTQNDAVYEIYDGPRPGWLRDILEYLPCLQSLMVSRLPFFDHNCMVALKSPQKSSYYNVRLLAADHEPNTTSVGLAETLLRFPLLTYLDLSYTTSARNQSVLSSLSLLENLQVLKLRATGLKDADAEFLANAIGKRVRFLDLRNNMLTDMAVRSLLQASFVTSTNAQQQEFPQYIRRAGHWPDPVAQSALRGLGSEFLKSPHLDEQYVKFLTSPVTSHPWVDYLPYSGITHLYIADNMISVEGVAALLASSNLHALDAGTVKTADGIHKHTSPPRDGKYPGAEKLVPILGQCAGDKLTYLRANHAILTAEPPSKDVGNTSQFLPELETKETPREAELDASAEAQIYELPATEAPLYELADTSTAESTSSMASNATVKEQPGHYHDEPFSSVRRGSAFAPEVVQTIRRGSAFAPEVVPTTSNASGSVDSIFSTPMNTSSPQTLQNHTSLQLFSTGFICESPGGFNSASPSSASFLSPFGSDDPRGQRIQELLAKRPRNQSLPLRSGKESRYPYLHPSHIPHCETLVLTNIPSHVPPNSPILYTLTRFIRACSNEALLATLQAGSDYSLPPGQARYQAEQQRSRSLFGLRRIIIEINDTSRTKLTSWKPANQRNGNNTSSTGDRDSEAMWASATDDFSFFGEEECGIPETDPGKYFPMAALNEKICLTPSDDDSAHSGTDLSEDLSQQKTTYTVSEATRNSQPGQLLQQVDLVAQLAAFRREKKGEYEALVTRERKRRSTCGTGVSSIFSACSAQVSMAHFVEGYWKGEVKIVRNPTPKVRSGVVDMYGNYFEKGYLYP